MDLFQPNSLLGSQSQGEIPSGLAPELVAKAAHEKFSGQLVINSQSQERVTFLFDGGDLAGWDNLCDQRIVRAALAEHLPPEQLGLVGKHALQFGQSETSAVKALQLLAPPIVLRLQEDCVVRQIQALATSEGALRFQYGDQEETLALHDRFEPSSPIFPILAESLLAIPDLSWFRPRVMEWRYTALQLMTEHLDPERPLHGIARQIVLALKRRPESVDSLVSQNVASENAVVAVLYALSSVGALVPCQTRAPSRAVERPQLPTNESQPKLQWPISNIRTDAGASTSGVRPIDLPGHAPERPSLPARHSSVRQNAEANRASTTGTPPPGERPSKGLAREESHGAKARTGHRLGHSAQRTRRAEKHPASTSTAPKYRNETELEQKALNAWMRAVDSPAQRKKALKFIEKVAVLCAHNAQIQFYLGCLYFLCEDYSEAETTMLRVLELDPDHIEARREYAKIVKHSRPDQGRLSLFKRWGSRRSG